MVAAAQQRAGPIPTKEHTFLPEDGGPAQIDEASSSDDGEEGGGGLGSAGQSEGDGDAGGPSSEVEGLYNFFVICS